MNDTWGFKSYDHNWKSVKTLLCLLTDLASKGVNYLLNIGPTADGVIPKPSVDRLAAIGKWMKVNSEAIYATQANPYPYELEWGRITQKPGKLYLLVYNWRRKLTLLGLRNKVKKVTLLADRKKKLAFTQESDRTLDLHRLDLSLPAKKPDKYVSVVVVEIAGNADVDEMVLQQSNGSVELAAHMARIHAPKTGRKAVVDVGGRVCGWSSKSNWLSWEFKVSEPGEFEVKIVVPLPSDKWKGGHRVKASVGRQAARGVIRPEEEIDSPRTKHGREVAATLGTISIGRAGTHKLTLKAETIKKSAGHLGVSAVQLAPVG
jgi:alpha-L-fucosidase